MYIAIMLHILRYFHRFLDIPHCRFTAGISSHYQSTKSCIACDRYDDVNDFSYLPQFLIYHTCQLESIKDLQVTPPPPGEAAEFSDYRLDNKKDGLKDQGV